ncbi:hypothetical protein KIPB_002375, partial [Kipferlia bialata]|eukprot:g2375.t1
MPELAVDENLEKFYNLPPNFGDDDSLAVCHLPEGQITEHPIGTRVGKLVEDTAVCAIVNNETLSVNESIDIPSTVLPLDSSHPLSDRIIETTCALAGWVAGKRLGIHLRAAFYLPAGAVMVPVIPNYPGAGGIGMQCDCSAFAQPL